MTRLIWCIAIPAIAVFFYWIYYYFIQKIPVESTEEIHSNMAMQDYLELLRDMDKINSSEEVHKIEDEILKFENFYAHKIPSNLNLFFTGRLYDHLLKIKNK